MGLFSCKWVGDGLERNREPNEEVGREVHLASPGAAAERPRLRHPSGHLQRLDDDKDKSVTAAYSMAMDRGEGIRHHNQAATRLAPD